MPEQRYLCLQYITCQPNSLLLFPFFHENYSKRTPIPSEITHKMLLFFFLLLFFPFSLSYNSNSTSIYDLLPKYGLPPGLLPDSVKSFSLSKNGSFDVQLESKCYVEFEYLVYYDANISGVLKYGSIRDLKGIQARKMLIWFDVDAIKVDLPPADYVYFEVGWITRKLKVDQFMDVHSCKKDKLVRFPDLGFYLSC